MKLLVVLLGIALIACVYFFVRPIGEPVAPAPEVPAARGPATFTWSYRQFERDSIPYSRISATATYADGSTETKEIDTIEGSCNVYEERDKDVYEKSDMIICYYAGLGRYYKITEAETGYEIERRIFEEGSPEYEPPTLPYEAIATFNY